MKGEVNMKGKFKRILLLLLIVLLLLSACSAGTQNSKQTDAQTNGSASSAPNISTDVFTDRDLAQTADLSGAASITVSNNGSDTISSEGVYVLSGTACNYTLYVIAGSDAKVQLVLDGVSITNDSTPCIIVNTADKVFLTTTDSENTMAVTGAFSGDEDAVVYSRDDLTLNGVGTLTVISAEGNGVSGKDDVKITGGTYGITSGKDAIEANDSISICGGDLTVASRKDGLHSEYSKDDTLGSVYISGGTLNISVAADAIQANSSIVIDGGTMNLSGREGIEATYVQINDGEITIEATDDGINASSKSSLFSTPTIEITGGTLTITMAAGDTDAVDANGNLIITGGRIDITAQLAFDFDGTVTFTGGTVYVNGSQMTQITNSMQGGMGGRR